MRSAKKRIQSYVEDPTIGIEEVEAVMDAAHALQFQTQRYGQLRSTQEELVEKYTKLIKEDTSEVYEFFDINRKPLEPDYDVLEFIGNNSRNMPAWKKDLIEIIREESQYFIPQMQTKIMNEGWASYWHYTLCHELDLPAQWHIPFIKMHNQVIRPHIGGLFSFSDKRKRGVTIDEIHDEEGWTKVKETLIKNIGSNGIPVIYVEEVEADNTLILRHEHDSRDLDLDHCDEVLRHVKTLWGDEAKLFTVIEEELWEI